MKLKYLSLILVAALAGCNQEQNPHLRKVDLSILAPTGAPAVAMYQFANGLTTVTSPQDELMPKFHTDEYDIIVAPAQGGLTKITKLSCQYKMAAVVTFGNFALVKVNQNDETPSAGDKVLFFQENDIPGKTFKYLYGDLGLTTYAVANANQTVLSLNTGTHKVSETETVQLDYVFSADPMITNIGKANQVYERASDAFTRKTEGKKIIQAAVFVNNNAPKTKVNKLLDLLESDINTAVSNPKKLKNTINLVGDIDEQASLFGIDSTIVYNCMKDYNGLGLGFYRASEHKDEINYFINDILQANLNITDEAYYQ